MGAAKRRGSYEQRKAEGQIRRADAQRQRAEEIAKREAALTPEERAKRRKAQMLLAQFATIAIIEGAP